MHYSPELPLHESIKALDKKGMDIIEQCNLTEFLDYMAETNNTICGRFPIQILLAAIEASKADKKTNADCKFTFYDQSSKVKNFNDSSVSYASAVMILYQRK
jgi:AmmeMemoRadiSam system protein B